MRASDVPGLAQEEPCPIQLPDPPRLFVRRAERFLALARESATADHLRFLARLALAQAEACRAALFLPSPALPPGMPGDPWDWVSRGRAPAWKRILGVLSEEMRRGPLPPPASRALAALRQSEAELIESIAARLLSDALLPDEVALAPFVGAAVQVDAACRASRADPAALGPPATECPVCGSPPVAGLVLGDQKLRTLSCSVCATAWHLLRVCCSSCGALSGITYFALDGGRVGMKAEACSACKGYLKLFYVEQIPDAEPLADDTASLTLDLLLAEAGYARAGRNLLLVSRG